MMAHADGPGVERSHGTRKGREADQNFDAVAKGFEGDVYGSFEVRRVRLGVLYRLGSYRRPRVG